MNLVDCSGWLEYFSNGKNARFFAPSIIDTKNLIVPVICIFEVFKRIAQQKDEYFALAAVTAMQQGQVIPLDANLSIHAAKMSWELKLAMADSIIWATAKAFGAIVWTQDPDFKDFPQVRFIPSQA